MGYGKSVLITQTVKKFCGKVAWFQIDKEDNNIYNFSICLLESLKLAIGKTEVFAEFSNYENISKNFYEQMVLDLMERIHENIDKIGKLAVVFDDFHHIKNEAVLNLVEKIVYNSGENITFIFATRSNIPFFLVKKVLCDEAVIINQDTIKFTYDEVLQLVNTVIKTGKTNEIAGNVYKYSEGWPAGAMLSIISNKNKLFQSGYESKFPFDDKKLLQDYFINGFYKNLPMEIQNFLLNTCVLDVLTPGVCNAVLKIHDSSSILDYLLQENIFITKINYEKGIYKYHSFLKDVLIDNLPQDKINENIEVAARYYLSQKDRKKAVELAMQINNFSIVEYAFNKSADEMIKNGEIYILEKWVEFLINSNSKLYENTLMNIGVYYINMGAFEKALSFLNKSDNIVLSKKDLSAHANIVISISIALRNLNRVDEALNLLLENRNNFKNSNTLTAFESAREIIRCLVEKKQLFKAEKLCKMVIEYAKSLKNSDSIVLFNKILMAIYYFEERYTDVIEFYETVKNKDDFMKSNNLSAFLDYVALSYFTLGEFGISLNILKKISEYEKEHFGFEAWSHNLIISFIMLMFCILDADERKYYYVLLHAQMASAEVSIESDLFYNQIMRQNDEIYYISREQLNSYVMGILKGFNNPKNSLADTFRLVMEDEGHDFVKFFSKALINIIFKEIQDKPNDKYDAKIKEICQNDLLQCCYFSVYSALFTSKVCKKDDIAKKIAICAINYLNSDASFKKYFNNEHISMIYKLANENQLSNTIKTNTKTSVRIKTFGNFEVYIGEDKTPIKWRTKKAKEIFAYLYYMGNNPIKRDKILLEFWPESDEKSAISLLHTNIYSIRNILRKYGIEDLIVYKDKFYYFNKSLISSDDSKLNALWEAHCKGLSDYYDKNINDIDVYTGSYMEDINGEFCDGKRASYESIFLNLCNSIAVHYMAENDYRQVIPILNKALRIDPYSQEMNMQLINAYIEIHDIKNATRAYKKYESMLREEFDVPVGVELTELLKNVM